MSETGSPSVPAGQANDNQSDGNNDQPMNDNQPMNATQNESQVQNEGGPAAPLTAHRREVLRIQEEIRQRQLQAVAKAEKEEEEEDDNPDGPDDPNDPFSGFPGFSSDSDSSASDDGKKRKPSPTKKILQLLESAHLAELALDIRDIRNITREQFQHIFQQTTHFLEVAAGSNQTAIDLQYVAQEIQTLVALIPEALQTSHNDTQNIKLAATTMADEVIKIRKLLERKFGGNNDGDDGDDGNGEGRPTRVIAGAGLPEGPWRGRRGRGGGGVIGPPPGGYLPYDPGNRQTEVQAPSESLPENSPVSSQPVYPSQVPPQSPPHEPAPDPSEPSPNVPSPLSRFLSRPNEERNLWESAQIWVQTTFDLLSCVIIPLVFIIFCLYGLCQCFTGGRDSSMYPEIGSTAGFFDEFVDGFDSRLT